LFPGQSVGVGNPVVAQLLPEILGFPDVKHVVCGIPHQVHPISLGGFAEEPLSQPPDERLRVGKKECLAHANKGLIQTGAQRQPNISKFLYRAVSAYFLLRASFTH